MLHFPKIRYLDQRTLDNGRQTNIYELDWTGLRQLPEPYNTEVNSLMFGIDDAYMTEIKRNQERATEEWSLGRPFDTIIRDMCITPAIEHVKVFFKLLWDCACPFAEDKDKWWLANAMAYRMWMGQTGSMCVRRNAELDLSGRLSDNVRFCSPLEHVQFYDFVSALEKHRENSTKEYSHLRIQEPYTSPFTGQKL